MLFSPKVHDFCRRLTSQIWFKNLILSIIILAGFQVGMETYTEERSIHKQFYQMINLIVIIVFVLEATVKILAEGDKPLNYFKDGWNRFDFFILLVCLLPFNSGYVAIVRMVRLFRVLKLISALPQLRLLASALIKSIPSIGNVIILLGLHFYIFGALATILFSQNDPIHFGTLHQSILSLFIVATLEDWTEMMYINMRGCDQFGYDAYMDACTNPHAMPLVSTTFFVSFVLTGSMIILNLFIGVIVNGMEESKSDMMMKELSERKEIKGELSADEEIVLIENEIQRLSSHMSLLNSRLFDVLNKVKRERNNQG